MDGDLIVFAITTVFFVGVAWQVQRQNTRQLEEGKGEREQHEKDINGLAARMRRDADRLERRHREVVLAIILTTAPERKDEIAKVLRQDW